MTRASTSEIDGLVAAPMRNALSPALFADACDFLVSQHSGDDLHRKLDALVTSLLTTLGYGEGMAIFIAHVSRCHAPAPTLTTTPKDQA